MIFTNQVARENITDGSLVVYICGICGYHSDDHVYCLERSQVRKAHVRNETHRRDG